MNAAKTESYGQLMRTPYVLKPIHKSHLRISFSTETRLYVKVSVKSQKASTHIVRKSVKSEIGLMWWSLEANKCKLRIWTPHCGLWLFGYLKLVHYDGLLCTCSATFNLVYLAWLPLCIDLQWKCAFFGIYWDLKWEPYFNHFVFCGSNTYILPPVSKIIENIPFNEYDKYLNIWTKKPNEFKNI